MIQLEDSHIDIIFKAMAGLGLSKKELILREGLSKFWFEDLKNGIMNEEGIRFLAKKLSLDAEKILFSIRKSWHPLTTMIMNVKQFNVPYKSMFVNVYLVWCENSKKGWLFDTGTQTCPIIEFTKAQGLKIDSIFLTHTHRDHIFCLDELKQNLGSPKVHVHTKEPVGDSILIEEGFTIKLGKFSLQALHTHGHSVGGLTYLIDGLHSPVAIVGDALFAGSMGGGMVSYQDALRTNREKIMTLPDETIICPGHGPMSTIGEEKKYNPFFPEF